MSLYSLILENHTVFIDPDEGAGAASLYQKRECLEYIIQELGRTGFGITKFQISQSLV